MARILGRIKQFLFPWLRIPSSSHFPLVRQFKFKEIKRATVNFTAFAASDSHGVVYKAQFSNGLVVAVREIRKSGQENDYFSHQVQILGRLHHRHLVALRGFSEGQARFLVFDYMGNGTLKEHLQDPLKTPLNWKSRVKIAADVAAALEYLQYFCDPPIHYAPINSSNIFLDENFTAKLSPMGTLGSLQNQSHGMEVAGSSEIDQKCEHIVFQYGVLVLELVTGQFLGNEFMEVVEWVQGSRYYDSFHNMVDVDLGCNYESSELKSLLSIARLCTGAEGKPLLSVRQVVRYLQRCMEFPISYV